MKNRFKSFRKGHVFCAALVLCFLFTACAGAKLSEDFNEEAINTSVNNVIGYIADKDSENLREMSNVKLKEALTDEVLDEIYEAIGEGGAFTEVVSTSMSGYKDKATEEEFAIVVVKAKYEYRNFIYTMTFTKQMKLAGLYYK